MMTRPLCFVLMPYHPAVESDGQRIDFEVVYDRLIVPAVESAGMAPVRAREDPRGGIFQKNMFERLVVCEFAIADLSTGNANVYYELGVRHGLRPYSTVLLFRKGWRLPLDVAHGSALEYTVGTNGEPIDLADTRANLVARLRQARQASIDSPVYQLVSGLPQPKVDHERIDTFRDHADRDERLRQQLDEAAHAGPAVMRAVETHLGELGDLDLSTALSLLVSYRSISAWEEVVRVVQGFARPVYRLDVIQEQYAMALNRCGQDVEAERVLKALLRKRPSSETYGLLGRIYKDRWRAEKSPSRRAGLLGRAIDAYLRGFETDWRDPYPGVNAVTLMSLASPLDRRLPDLLPVVRYAADRRLTRAGHDPDYWDHATDLVLAVLMGDQDRAHRALECALAAIRDRFEPETTARDLGWAAEAMRRRGEDAAWVDEMTVDLEGVVPL